MVVDSSSKPGFVLVEGEAIPWVRMMVVVVVQQVSKLMAEKQAVPCLTRL